jgi:hypothetical protein
MGDNPTEALQRQLMDARAEVARLESELARRRPKPQVERLYFLENVKWRTGDRMRTAARYSVHEVPSSLVKKALATGAAIRENDPHVARLIPAFGKTYCVGAHPRDCIDLDRLSEDTDLRHLSASVVREAQQAV